MPKNITSFRVFIASPGGLDDIRSVFHDKVANYNRREALPRNVLFEAVGWEFTRPGAGRPQALINHELASCDHVIFVFRDRFGSQPGDGSLFSSGCEEEWHLANECLSRAR